MCRETPITLLNRRFHPKTFQVVINAGESLFIHINCQHVCFGSRFEDVGGFTAWCCTQI
ncbi:hypothetical protein KL86APRO_60002 [uncultured Alphaproteobacteria bacterium]|uniref:Uncharacterized protein n=1 Tax=uncultured Alphaproteobacteria bacterium TaxID=91750 RepID=A0A212KMW9_9PROT|nr:hypothetical protein KL86APRO_60002 [uncultured Alphaproteobacteria bacterium]